ncbi:MAG: malonyl-CoA decarboxylase [Candidatus Eremiobacteraeota bacterium]|nr:malonyl-CoA decarboxylase [Candidatus Eremiobacteraeota bacterium]
MIRSISGWREARAASHDRKALQRLGDEMRACLDARGGEVSARARAATLGKHYLELDAEGREQFFRLLGTFDLDPVALGGALLALRESADDEERFANARLVRHALQAPWIKLLTQFNSLPEGVKFLVDLRADLLGMIDREPVFARIDADLREILASWFDIGFLELRQITWDAPASFLERLARYEAVHEVRGWLDLKHRLQGNRRCFAFLHPAMPDEPLIFVEIALTDRMSGDMAGLLDRRAEPLAGEPTVAIFYSISNCHKGLSGISFGNALIKRVGDRLASEFRSLRTFATLSPVPGFMTWLQTQLAEDPGGIAEALARRGWHRDSESTSVLRAPLLRLCAHYLLREKRGAFARDPVANFHLSNGARLERINWLADLSPKGLRESAGIMVNYAYALDRIDENHEGYMTEGRIAASTAVRDLLRPAR